MQFISYVCLSKAAVAASEVLPSHTGLDPGSVRVARPTAWRVSCAVLVAALLLGAAHCEALTIADGGVHSIDYAVNGSIDIYDTIGGLATTVDLAPGGMAASYLSAYDNTIFTLSGGLIGEYLNAQGNSYVTISSGAIGSWMYVADNSRVDVTGGLIGSWIDTQNNSQLTISGGMVGDGLSASHNSRITISGGSVAGPLSAYNNSLVIISGGYFGDLLTVDDNGQVIIMGSDFNFGLGRITETQGTLTGTLQNGDSINFGFHLYSANASITLIPEPATLLLLGLGSSIVYNSRHGR